VVVLDASVLIAHLSTHDTHHAAATSLLGGAAPETLLVHPMTMAEILVGGVRVGRAEHLRRLRAVGVILSTPDDDQPLRLAMLRVDTGLRLPDCCVLDTSVQHDAPVASFDQRLLAAATGFGVGTLP
jgi:predicted nucleic acid-binding protein